MTLHVKKYKVREVDVCWAVFVTAENYEEAKVWCGEMLDGREYVVNMWLVREGEEEWNLYSDEDFERIWEAC